MPQGSDGAHMARRTCSSIPGVAARLLGVTRQSRKTLATCAGVGVMRRLLLPPHCPRCPPRLQHDAPPPPPPTAQRALLACSTTLVHASSDSAGYARERRFAVRAFCAGDAYSSTGPPKGGPNMPRCEYLRTRRKSSFAIRASGRTCGSMAPAARSAASMSRYCSGGEGRRGCVTRRAFWPAPPPPNVPARRGRPRAPSWTSGRGP